jgi:hypothetical protein
MGTLMQGSIGECPVQVGDVLQIVRGPFAGLFGWFAGSSGQRVLIEMEVLAGTLRVEMNFDWVDTTPAKRKPVSSVEGSETQRRSKS